MNKDDAIWLGIRTLGFVTVVQGGMAIVRLATYCTVLVSTGSLDFVPRVLTYHWSMGVVKQCVIVALMIYLLRYGRALYRLVAKISVIGDEAGEYDLARTVAVRTAGLWFLLQSLLTLLNVALIAINALLFAKYRISGDGVAHVDDGFFAVLKTAFCSAAFLEKLAAFVVFSAIAWYLMNHGQYLITFISWRKRAQA